MESKKHYMLGLSGGVDSATCAYLLRKKHGGVQPIFMHNWQEDEYCHIADDLADCQAVCQHLEIELNVINFQEEYYSRVFQKCLALFEKGLTPNPDILCNNLIKFDLLSEHAKKLGFDGLATGHYAHTELRDGKTALIQAPDPIKDQTYFLSQLTQSQLSFAHFPLGQYNKSQVRDIAKEMKLPNALKKDSVGICFIGQRRFDEFLKEYLLTRPGPIADTKGNIIGEHQGLFCHTIGQRKGLGIGGIAHSKPSPWYVIAKNRNENTLVVSQNPDDLLSHIAYVEPIHWIREPAQADTLLHAKIRHGPEMTTCHIKYDNQQAYVEFTEAQAALTPGQYIVFYSNGECLGSSMIIT